MNTEKPLTYLLGQTMHLVKLRLIARFKEHQIDLNLEQFIILNQIETHDELTQQDLANHFQRDKSIILRLINSLIELRYVVRLQDKEDKRKKNLILTKKGYDTLVFIKNIAQEVSLELLDGISSDEISIFENVINKIQENTGFQAHESTC